MTRGPLVDFQPKGTSIRNEHQSGQGYLRRLAFVDLAAATTDTILNNQATSNTVTTTVTSFLAQPAVPRNLVITPGGTTNDVPAGNVVVTGTDIRDQVISENFAFLANATDPTVGAKAFKTITSILFPIQDGASATYDVGIGAKIGFDRILSEDAVLYASADKVYETTRPTIVTDATDICKNTFVTNTAPNGSRDFAIGFVTKELY